MTDDARLLCDSCYTLIGYGDGDLNCCEFLCPSCNTKIETGERLRTVIFMAAYHIPTGRKSWETNSIVYTRTLPCLPRAKKQGSTVFGYGYTFAEAESAALGVA